jgi:MraZ protein
MFIGQYTHHLESKGRLSVPKKFRSQLEPGAIISQGLDGCLFLYPKETWVKLTQKLLHLPLTNSGARSFTRILAYSAVEVDFDSLGRILIPDYLKKYASISASVVFAGALERVEVWDQSRFDHYSNQISAQAEDLAEKLALVDQS